MTTLEGNFAANDNVTCKASNSFGEATHQFTLQSTGSQSFYAFSFPFFLNS